MQQWGGPQLGGSRTGKWENPRSHYVRGAVEAWLHNRETARQTSDVASLELERSRRERAQALLALQTYQMRAKELLPRAEVDRVWSQHVTAVRAKLLSLPVTMADRVHHAAKIDGVGSVERILSEAIRDVLRELSGTPELKPALRCGSAWASVEQRTRVTRRWRSPSGAATLRSTERTARRPSRRGRGGCSCSTRWIVTPWNSRGKAARSRWP